MTTKKLNRDIYRLLKLDETELQKEYLRVYHADNSFESMDRKSILIMLRLNIRHRFIALQYFGLFIDLEKL
jgi:hypothetical protein